MRGEMRSELISPTPLTLATSVAIAFSLAFLVARFSSLPALLPVHFKADGFPDGWQYKTYPLVLVAVGVIGPTVILGLLLR